MAFPLLSVVPVTDQDASAFHQSVGFRLKDIFIASDSF